MNRASDPEVDYTIVGRLWRRRDLLLTAGCLEAGPFGGVGIGTERFVMTAQSTDRAAAAAAVTYGLKVYIEEVLI